MVRRTSSFMVSAWIVALLGCADPPLEPSSPADHPLTATASALASPSNATAAGVSETQIDVAWVDRSSSETRFEIHRSTTGTGGTFTLLATSDANVTHYSDRKLELVPVLCYKVRAIRISGSKTSASEFSNTACATAPPAAPSNANAVASPWPRIDLSWEDHSSIETWFLILRSTDGDNGTFAPLFWASANALAVSDPSVVVGTRYCYRVEAVRQYTNAGGSTDYIYSTPSNTTCATPPPPTAPPPSAYQVGAKPASSGSVTVTVKWTDNSTPPPAFRTYRSTDGGTVWSLISLAGGANGDFSDAPVVSDQQLCYRVIAYNAAGDAAPSSPACTAAPARPTNLVGTVLDPQTLELTWSDNSTVEDGYEVWVGWYRGSYYCYPPGSGAQDAGTWEGEGVAASLGPNTTSYRATLYDDSGTCDPPTVYWYWVVAKKDGGTSAGSESVYANGSGPVP